MHFPGELIDGIRNHLYVEMKDLSYAELIAEQKYRQVIVASKRNLYAAVLDDNATLMRFFMTQTDITFNDNFLIRKACTESRPKIIRLLIQVIMKSTQLADCALIYAYENGDTEIFKILIEDKYKVLPRFIINCRNDAALDSACRMGYIDIARIVLERQGSANREPQMDNWRLCNACRLGHLEIVKILLKEFSEETISMDDEKAFRTACSSGHVEIAELLIQDRDMRDLDDHFKKQLAAACCQTGHVGIAKLLLPLVSKDYLRSQDNYIMRTACKMGHFEILELLLAETRSGARVFTDDDLRADKNILLRIVASCGNTKIAEVLLKRLNADDIRQCEALSLSSHEETIDVLVRHMKASDVLKTAAGKFLRGMPGSGVLCRSLIRSISV